MYSYKNYTKNVNCCSSFKNEILFLRFVGFNIAGTVPSILCVLGYLKVDEPAETCRNGY